MQSDELLANRQCAGVCLHTGGTLGGALYGGGSPLPFETDQAKGHHHGHSHLANRSSRGPAHASPQQIGAAHQFEKRRGPAVRRSLAGDGEGEVQLPELHLRNDSHGHAVLPTGGNNDLHLLDDCNPCLGHQDARRGPQGPRQED